MTNLKIYIAAIVTLATIFTSCVDSPEDFTGAESLVKYRNISITLDSGSQPQQESDEESRLEAGDIVDGRMAFNWSEGDSIGIFLLNLQPKHINHSAVGVLHPTDSNRASFSFTTEVVDNGSMGSTDTVDGPIDMFVYYPYNSSLVVPQSYTSGNHAGEPYFGFEYLQTDLGLVYRVPALQTVLEDEEGRQGCTKAMSRYASCYDFVRVENGTAKFKMQHRPAFLRVRVTGSQIEGGEHYGNGDYLLKSVVVHATYPDGEEEKQANIAGTYHMGYDYEGNGSTITGDEILTPISTGGITHVSCQLHTPLPLREHNNIKDGSENDNGRYALLTISPSQFEKVGVNKLIITVHLIKKIGEHESANISITRTLNIKPTSIQRGGFYDIAFNAYDPIDKINYLDDEDSANTYIVTSPGTYRFTANSAGNGVLPYKTTFEELGISEQLIDDSKHYDVDWLWASGDVFNGRSVDDVFEVEYSSPEKSIFFTLRDGLYNASGNVVLALYEKMSENDDTVKQIVWSWHIWLAEPHYSHFRFANTRASIALNNEEWHMLDRNLGAEAADLSYKAFGCYYQVGRKDPFIGPNKHGGGGIGNNWWNWTDEGVEDWSVCRLSTLQNTEKFGVLAQWKAGVTNGSISGYNDVETYRHRYPMWLISRDFEHAHLDRSKYAWVHTEGQADFNTKTLFDPCPPGYKLPTTREWDNFKNNEFEYSDPVAYSSGPFGYCTSTEAEASIKAMSMTNGAYDYPETHDAWATLAARREAGDYYEVDEYNGRRYHTVTMSAHGDEIITCFPASGAIQDGGAFYSIGANFALWASGRVEPIDGKDYTNTRYDAHWFGVKDNWYSDWKESYDWVDTGSWRVYCPYLRDDSNWSGRKNIANNPIGTQVLGLGSPAMATDATGHHSGLGAASNYAAPVRCIRQYDSTAGRTVMSQK